MLTPPTHHRWWFTSDVTRNHHILLASTSREIAGVDLYVMCAARFLNVKNRPVPGLNMWFDLRDVRVSWFILPGTQTLQFLQQCHCTLCGKSNTPRVFQVTRVSHYCVSYPPVYSCTPQSEHERGRRRRRRRDAAVAVSWLVTFHWRSLQGASGPTMGD